MKKFDDQQLVLDIFCAYFDARKNKRQTCNALAFENDYEKKLFKLYYEIKNRTYEIGPSTCFVVEKPVKREIFAADFRDRIVHHLIFNAINPIFEKHFIKDSYSCRVGKGTSYGIKRVEHFMRACSENHQKKCFVLKLDIQGYFMSMDRNILYAKIEKKLKSHFLVSEKSQLDLLLYLLQKVIFNDPTANCHVKGKRQDWVGLPKSKSLFFAKKSLGFPIGNLTSQLFGNIYLDSFDHFVREDLKIKFYGRYVDDMVFVHSDKEFLKAIILKVKAHLQTELKLTLHPKKIYLQPNQQGVGFLGVFIKPHRTYISKRTKRNFFQKIKQENELLAGGKVFSQKEAKKIRSWLNSYLGIMQHYDTFKLRKKLVGFLNLDFFKFFSFSENFEKASLRE